MKRKGGKRGGETERGSEGEVGERVETKRRRREEGEGEKRR